ncbi:hypothetical protein LI82_06575 [Methanococcoides methylutens]|uniref:Uncharacterized protein n=1 Tax=Methanococcoides methylutens TaxID=2226 RepID=A0A099T067_METMT|nr:hypothetical protein [Methanococcoides methylutens]KGK98537.1 hypothetical protein LI82_06575 [Methanococcoides methylutens]
MKIVKVSVTFLTMLALLVSIPAVMGTGYTDVKPGSCPNPINLKSNGVVSIAVAGYNGFNGTDLSTINLDTLMVQFNANGVKNVSIERYSFEDVINDSAAPGFPCCNPITEGDGVDDLVVKVKMANLKEHIIPATTQMRVIWQVDGSDQWSGSSWDQIQVFEPPEVPKPKCSGK